MGEQAQGKGEVDFDGRRERTGRVTRDLSEEKDGERIGT